MLSKCHSSIVYLSLILSLIYYSFIIRLYILYGYCNIASLFEDPKNLGVNFYLELSKFSHLINIVLIMPIGLLLTPIVIWKKAAHRDTIILFFLNCIIVYLCFYYGLDFSNWIFD